MKTFLLLVAFFLFKSLFGQTIDQGGHSIETNGFFTIELSPILTSKIKYANSGADLARSKNLISGEIGIGYERRLNENINWRSSIGIGLMPYNFNFEFDAPESSIFQTGPYQVDYEVLDFNWSEYDYIRLYSSIDVVFSTNVFSLKSGDKISLGAGARAFVFLVDDFEYEYYSSWYIDENNTDVQLFYANINDTVANRLKFSVLLEARYTMLLKNNQKLASSIFINYSPFKNVKGYYNFSNLGFSSNGTFGQSLTYIGLRLSYLLPHEKVEKNSGMLNPMSSFDWR